MLKLPERVEWDPLPQGRASIMDLAPTLAYKSGIKKEVRHFTGRPQSPLQTVRAFISAPEIPTSVAMARPVVDVCPSYTGSEQ
jgi:hypothetical protein